MAQLAHCPACKSNVVLPDNADDSAPTEWAQCPECDEVFAVADAQTHAVKQAKLVASPLEATSKPLGTTSKTLPAVEPEPVAKLSDGADLESKATDVSENTAVSENGETDEPSDIKESKPRFGSATLASFLSDGTEERNEGNTSDSEADSVARDAVPKTDSPTLADFSNLDELIRRAPVEPPTNETPEVVPPTIAPGADDLIADARLDETGSSFQDQEAEVTEEPSPALDRLRPTLGEFFGSSPAVDNEESGAPEPAVSENDVSIERSSTRFDSGSYDHVEDVAETATPVQDDFASPEAFESTLRDRGDLGDLESVVPTDDAPSFDFEVDGESELDASKSLRASMGFANSDSLEVELPVERPDFATVETHDNQDVAPELSFAGSDSPRGVVAARRRSGAMSAVRTMMGVAGGGVVGIAAGYLILLWIFHFIGRTDEPLELAQYYPNVVKPATFQDDGAAADSQSADDQLANNADQLVSTDPLPTVDDSPTTDLVDLEVDTANYETDLANAGKEPEPWELETVPPVLVTGAPLYPAAELQQLTLLAEESVDGLLDGTFDDAAVRPIKGGSYAKIAKLADALTFGEGAVDVSWKNDARRVFPQLFATPKSRQEVSLIAGYWLMSDKRGHGGIFLCGQPDAGRQQGSVAEYLFTLPSGQTLTVLTSRAMPINVARASMVAVVGSVIDDPAVRIEGYTGTASQAIWTNDLFPVSE